MILKNAPFPKKKTPSQKSVLVSSKNKVRRRRNAQIALELAWISEKELIQNWLQDEQEDLKSEADITERRGTLRRLPKSDMVRFLLSNETEKKLRTSSARFKESADS